MTGKAGEDLFLVFTSSLAGVFVKLKPSLKLLDPPLMLHVSQHEKACPTMK